MSALDRLSKRSSAVPMTAKREIQVPLDKIKFDPTQPRKAFHHLDGRIAEKDEAYIDELAKSIQERELIQAITVQEQEDGTYLVVVGECRTRAHLKLGLSTIRAVVRNDLKSSALRLLYQLAENVNRQDLTDDELAGSIRHLLEGGDGVEPMAQVQIAAHLGKSEGWVSRFVKFGDEELQRVWVKSGIADTVEKFYRLSILPKALQVDILRRVELPEGHYDRLEKPLNRNVIDELAREAKVSKKMDLPRAQVSVGNAMGLNPNGSLPSATHEGGHQTAATSDGLASDDAIGQAFAQAAMDGRANEQVGAKESSAIHTGGYQLSDDARAKILGTVPQTDIGTRSEMRESIKPPVNCKVVVSNLEALLDVLKSNKDMLSSMRGVRCELNIPGELAQLVANELMGMIVDDKEVPAIIQAELTKLG